MGRGVGVVWVWCGHVFCIERWFRLARSCPVGGTALLLPSHAVLFCCRDECMYLERAEVWRHTFDPRNNDGRGGGGGRSFASRNTNQQSPRLDLSVLTGGEARGPDLVYFPLAVGQCQPHPAPPLPHYPPKVIGVKLTGKLSGWTSPKDIILKVTSEAGQRFFICSLFSCVR